MSTKQRALGTLTQSTPQGPSLTSLPAFALTLQAPVG